MTDFVCNGACGSCGHEVIWGKSLNGKGVAVNPIMVSVGTRFNLISKSGKPLVVPVFYGSGYQSHFANCKDWQEEYGRSSN